MRRIRPRVVALTSLAVILMACSETTASQPPAATGGGVRTSGAAPSQAAATTTPRPSTTPGPGDVVYSGRIDVGGGRQLEVRCAGVGSPTILLEGGGITPSMDEYPSSFVFDLAKTTTTCQYSRAGGGTSSPPTGQRTMAGLVGDVDAMLAALKDQADVQGPYLFAGWSFGGTVALAEALAHPDHTVGLVILDTDFVTEFMGNCIKSGRTKADCEQEYQDDIDAKSLEKELLPKIHPLPDIPMRIVSAMRFPECDPSNPDSLKATFDGKMITAKDCAALAEAFATEQQKGWSTVQPQLQQLRVDADHNGLIDQAGKEIEGLILDLVRAARTNP